MVDSNCFISLYTNDANKIIVPWTNTNHKQSKRNKLGSSSKIPYKFLKASPDRTALRKIGSDVNYVILIYY